MPRRSQINIKAIEREFDLTFLEVMEIIKSERWHPLDTRNINFDRETVYAYFKKNGIAPKTLTYKQIIKLSGLNKEDVFKLIRIEKWKPLNKDGALWTFHRAPIEEFFANHNPALIKLILNKYEQYIK